jgi:membrane protein YqaA with SNARE-associated domain
VGYVVMALVVFGVNLLPAFGPPTWSVLVLFRLRSHLNPVALVVIGALAAATGRYLLAEVCRHLSGRLSKKRTENLQAAKKVLLSGRVSSIVGLALFAVSPVPSAQLFEAAGLMAVPLVPLTALFFVGRIVSYSLYVVGASAVKNTNVGRVLTSSLTSPVGIAIEVAMLAGVVALTRVDWVSLASRNDHRSARPR